MDPENKDPNRPAIPLMNFLYIAEAVYITTIFPSFACTLITRIIHNPDHHRLETIAVDALILMFLASGAHILHKLNED